MESIKDKDNNQFVSADSSKHKHGDKVLCPFCGLPGTLDEKMGFPDDKPSFEDSIWDDDFFFAWRCIKGGC